MEWIMLSGRLISVQHNLHRRLMKLKICPKIVFILIFFVLCTLFFVVPKIEAAESLYYIHQDHLGSTSLVTDSTGKVVSKQSYYPYGTTRSYSQLTADNSQPERQYTGQVSDQDQTGLYYYNARYYNPQIGKFSQADKFNSCSNKYAYVGNNPVVNSDPSGNLSLRCASIIGCQGSNKKTNYVKTNSLYQNSLSGNNNLIELEKSNTLSQFDSNNPLLSINATIRGEDLFQYVAQTTLSTCGPASLAMLITSFKGYKDAQNVYEEILDYFNYDSRPSLLLGEISLMNYLKEENISSILMDRRDLDFNPENIDKLLENGPLFIDITSNYGERTVENPANHWIIVDQVVRSNLGTYVIIRDSLRSPAFYGSLKEVKDFMRPHIEGSVIIPFDTFEQTTGNKIIVIDEARTTNYVNSFIKYK